MHSPSRRDRDRKAKAKNHLQFGLSPPPSIRWRLMLLVGLLFLVLVLMRYAAQPANWAWMGFANEDAKTATESPRENAPAIDDDGEAIISARRPDASASPAPQDASQVAPKIAEADPKTLDMQMDFWTRVVRRLDEPSRMALFALFRPSEFVDAPVSPEARTNLIERVEKFNDSYTTDLLAQSGDLNGNNLADQQRWYDALFQWQSDWSAAVQPVLKELAESGAVSEGNKAPYDSLAQTLHNVAAELVVDKAPMGRAIEIPFWNELFDDLRSQSWSADKAQTVRFIELLSQPTAYRGKPVRLSGRLRGIRLQQSATTPSIPFYFELWIQPDEGGSIPYCVYALEMPPDFPAVGEQMMQVDAPTTVEGIFFKTCSYLSENRKTNFCPVVLSKQPAISIPVGGSIRPKPPSLWAFSGMTTLILLLAAWIAFRVYRSTIHQRRKESNLVYESLKTLEGDPDVVSVSERVARWGQSIGKQDDGSDKDSHSE